jgi:hypothetical protein
MRHATCMLCAKGILAWRQKGDASLQTGPRVAVTHSGYRRVRRREPLYKVCPTACIEVCKVCATSHGASIQIVT